MRTEQKKLNELARDYVGDDKSQLWFVSDGSNVVMVTTDEESATAYWRRLASRRPMRESTLENRSGIVESVDLVCTCADPIVNLPAHSADADCTQCGKPYRP